MSIPHIYPWTFATDTIKTLGHDSLIVGNEKGAVGELSAYEGEQCYKAIDTPQADQRNSLLGKKEDTFNNAFFVGTNVRDDIDTTVGSILDQAGVISTQSCFDFEDCGTSKALVLPT